MKRTLCAMAFFAVAFVGTILVTPSRAAGQTVVSAQGNPSAVDFFALSAKRPALRAAIAHQGLDAAFSDWLRAERPAAYRQAAAQPATLSAVSARWSSCCKDSTTCCPRCPACCVKANCTMRCCDTTICATQRPTCCK